MVAITKKKNIFLLTILMLILFVGISVSDAFLPNDQTKEQSYQQALDFEKNNDFLKAYLILDDLGDFQDSSQIKIALLKKIQNEAEVCSVSLDMEHLAEILEAIGLDPFEKTLKRLESNSFIYLFENLSSSKAASIIKNLPLEETVFIFEHITTDHSSEIISDLISKNKGLKLATEIISSIKNSISGQILSKMEVMQTAEIIGSADYEKRIELIESIPRSKAIDVLNCYSSEFALKFLRNTDSRLTAFYINQVDSAYAHTILDSIPSNRLPQILTYVNFNRVVEYLWSLNEVNRNDILSHISDRQLSHQFINTGDVIEFGSYPYEKDGLQKPIRWIVLKTDSGQIFLVSEKAVDCQPFHNEYKQIGWSNSYLRNWLNSSFLQTAFKTEKEMKSLLNRSDGDKVSLLSIKETETYLSPLRKTSAEPTPYASKHGADTGFLSSNTKWWLRNSGENNSDKAAAVHPNGNIDRGGENVNQTNRGVRPSIIISSDYFFDNSHNDNCVLYQTLQSEYNNGLSNIKSDNYDKSVSFMKSVSGFLDSDELLKNYQNNKIQNALTAGKQGNYDQAVAILGVMQEYFDAEIMSDYYLKQQIYENAIAAIESDDYKNASNSLEQIISFKDSSYRLESYRKDRLSRAEKFAKDNNFDSALNLTEIMDDFDPAIKITKTYKNWKTYRLAEEAIAADDYLTAEDLLTSLNNFEDSKRKLSSYQDQRIQRARNFADMKEYANAYALLAPMKKVNKAQKASYEIQQMDLYDQFTDAASELRYEDAIALSEKIDKDLSEEITQLQSVLITNARKLGSEKKYSEAYAILSLMENVEDAQNAFADIQKDDSYDQGVAAIESDDYLKAKEIFLEISAYKDSALLFTNFRDSRISAAKSMAKEKQYKEAYDLLEPMGTDANADQVMADIRKEDHYDQALDAIERDDYEKANSLLSELGSYRDCSTRLNNYRNSRVTSAKNFAADKDYKTAYNLLLPMEGVTIADQALADIRKADQYDQGLAAIEKDDYETASKLLTELGYYKDSSYQLLNYRNARIKTANKKADEKDYEGAYDILRPMEGYPEADRTSDLIQKAEKYDLLVVAIEKDEYQTASELMSNLHGYKDANQKMFIYQNQRIAKAKELVSENQRAQAYDILNIMDDSVEAVRIRTQMKNEDQYASAMIAIDEDDYETANKILTEIANFKDSTYQLNAYRTARINAAKNAASEKKYEDAYQILNVMVGYAEADRVLSDIKNAELYDKALSFIELDSYEDAVTILTELKAYKDSNTQLYNYRLSRINRAKTLASEKNYAGAYEILETMSDSTEATRLLADIHNQEDYASALTAIEHDDYELAVKILTGLGYFKDSQTKLQTYRTSRITSAKNLANDGNYESAYSILSEMNDYPEAVKTNETLHKDEQYSKAMALIEMEDYISAKTILEELGTHKNSNSQLYILRTNCRMNAVNKINDGDYSFAVKNIDVLDNTNIIALINSLSAPNAKKLLEELNTAGKLKNIFLGLDPSGRIRILTLMENDNAATFLNTIPSEEIATLFKSMNIQTVVSYLITMDKKKSISILDSLDKSTAIYYINSMKFEDASSVFKAMTDENTATYFKKMTNYSVANIIKDWSETNRIAVFKLMDYSNTKEIYAILNLPKLITTQQTTYYLKEKGKETVKYKLVNSNIDTKIIKLVMTNDIVAKASIPSFSSENVSFTVNAINPGSVYMQFETIYGRVISDQIVVSVIRNTPTPVPQRYHYSTSSDITGDNNNSNIYSGGSSYSNNNSNGGGSSYGYSGTNVWIYSTGKRYHSHHGCSGSNDWEVSLEEAQNRGLTPCGKCY